MADRRQEFGLGLFSHLALRDIAVDCDKARLILRGADVLEADIIGNTRPCFDFPRDTAFRAFDQSGTALSEAGVIAFADKVGQASAAPVVAVVVAHQVFRNGCVGIHHSIGLRLEDDHVILQQFQRVVEPRF